MCGIYGSNSLATLKKLNEINLDRGASSRGYCVIYDNYSYSIQRTLDDVKGPFILDNSSPFANYNNNTPLYHLGHLRSPTNENSSNSTTIHPFENDEVIIAHNGIISNFIELKQEYDVSNVCGIDSEIIPLLISKFGLKKTCEKLKGTFAFWCYNKIEKKIYLVRHECSLFINDKGDFSSIRTDDINIEVENNSVKTYNITSNKWDHIYKYKNISNYFI